MFKEILNNQKGMSLIEVIVASVISIIIAMGVVKINESSMQGFKSIELKSEILGIENQIRGILLSQDKCSSSSTAGSGFTITNDGTDYTSGMITATDFLPPGDEAVNTYRQVDTLTLVRGPGGDGIYGNGDDSAMVIGPAIPGSPNWTASSGSRIYVDIPNENCYLMIQATKSAAADRSSFGAETKLLWFNLKCSFNGANEMTSCAGQDVVAEGIFTERAGGNGEWETDKHLWARETLQVGGGVYDDTTPADGRFDTPEVLRVVGDTNDPDAESPLVGIGLPMDNSILLGAEDAAFSINRKSEIWHDSDHGLKISSENIYLTSGSSGLGGIRLNNSNQGGIRLDNYHTNPIGIRNWVGALNLQGETTVNMTTGTGNISLTAAGDLLLTSASRAQLHGDVVLGLSSGGEISMIPAAGQPVVIPSANLNAQGGINASGDCGAGLSLCSYGGIYSEGEINLQGGGNPIQFNTNGGILSADTSGSEVRFRTAGGPFVYDGGGASMIIDGGSGLEVTGAIASNTTIGASGTITGSSYVFNISTMGTSPALSTPNPDTISSNKAFQSLIAMYAPDYHANNYYYFSDERFKKQIETIKRASEKLEDLRGVTYFLRSDEFPEKRFDKDLQYGLIAQEVEAVFPELVETSESGYKSVKYANIVAVLIEGFKEQMAEIKKNREMFLTMKEGIRKKDKEQDNRLSALEAENKKLKAEVKELKDKLYIMDEKLNKIMNKLKD